MSERPGASTPEKQKKAGRSIGAWLLLLVLTGGFVAADLVSKDIAFARIDDKPVVIDKAQVMNFLQTQPGALNSLVPRHEPVVVAPSLLEFKLVLNPGAVFGTGAGNRWFFIGFTIVALLVAAYVFARSTGARHRVTHLGIALILAGGIGNLYDRVVFACVRDFIHPFPGVLIPGTKHELWPFVSNVADAFLLIGIAIIMIKLWRHERALAQQQHDESEQPGAEEKTTA